MNDSPRRPVGPFLLPVSGSKSFRSLTLSEITASINQEVTTQPHLAQLRDFNHAHVKVVSDQCGGVRGRNLRLLDVGASVHGYALEAAVGLGYEQYIGIDLGISRVWGAPFVEVTAEDKRHLLCQMDAHRLWLEDESVDAVICLSGFEHYLYPEFALQEMLRVLRKGGVALISYEPIWTCSYGHHLHHFGLTGQHVPPWSHLLLNKQAMTELLAQKPWPAGCAVTRTEAVDWIYSGRDINRQDFRFHQQLLTGVSCQTVKWLVPHLDESPAAIDAADYAATLLPYSRTELLTRGFSFCCVK